MTYFDTVAYRAVEKNDFLQRERGLPHEGFIADNVVKLAHYFSHSDNRGTRVAYEREKERQRSVVVVVDDCMPRRDY